MKLKKQQSRFFTSSSKSLNGLITHDKNIIQSSHKTNQNKIKKFETLSCNQNGL